jgi:hypothetical protein
MTDTISSSTVDLLTWLSSRPRTYDETMAAWRTHCPRLSIWEDALAGGLVQVTRGDNGRASATVSLTRRGRAALDVTPTR